MGIGQEYHPEFGWEKKEDALKAMAVVSKRIMQTIKETELSALFDIRSWKL